MRSPALASLPQPTMPDDSQLPDTAPKVPDLSHLPYPTVLDQFAAAKMDLPRPTDPAIKAGKITIAAMQNFMSGKATYSALKMAAEN
jgi:hypothetical protein